MKSSIFRLFVFALMMIGLVSCDENFNPEGIYSQTANLQINVNAFPFVERQKDFIEEKQLFYNGTIPDDDLRLRLRAYIYKNNTLVGIMSGLYNCLSDKIKMTKADLSIDTRYDVIVVADFVMMSGEKIDLEFWAVKDDANYDSIKIVDQGYTGLQYRSVGVAYASIYGGEDVSVDIVGLGMLAYMYFSNIDNYNIKSIDYYWSDVKEYLLGSRQVVSTTTYYETYETNSSYSGCYDYRYIIPALGSICEYGWKLYGTLGQVANKGEEAIRVTPSDNRLWQVNCSTGTFSNDYYNY
ncbi:MAG: hypothetical protein IKV77_02335 [Alistipes sp.]|nr:hypothetical protein [Alistipes sp.]